MREPGQDHAGHPPAPGASLRTRLAGLAFAAVVIAAVFLVYRPVWHAGFIWDDDAHLTAHRCIAGPLGFAEIWTTSEANYFPLVLTHFWVLHKLFGFDPTAYHLITIGLHAVAGLLLWRVLTRLRVPAPWLGAVIWTLHPVQVESVAWVSEFTNTQSGVFFLLGLWFGLRWLEPSGGVARPRDYWFAFVCALAAVLSKPSAVMFPVALALCAWWVRRRWQWRDLVWLAPFVVISGAMSGWAVWEQKFHSGAVGAAWNQSLGERFVVAGRALWFYLGKIVWPEPLSFVYPRWHVTATAVQLLPLVAALVIALVLVAFRRRVPALVLAGGFFGALLFPVLGFFSVYYFRFSFVADHFQYLASMAPCALIGGAIGLLGGAESRAARASRYAVAAALLIALAWRSRERVGDFVDNDTVWRATLVHNPDCVLALSNLSASLLGSEDVAKARDYAGRAVAVDPSMPEAHFNLGKAWLRTPGEDARAVAEFETAVRLDPKLQPAYLNLGNALMAEQPPRRQEAIEAYKKAIELEPGDGEAESNLGLALAAVPGRLKDAIAHARSAVRLNGQSPEAHLNLGVLLSRLPDSSGESVGEFRQALALNPSYVKAHLSLGEMLLASGSVAAAVDEFKAAVRLAPDSAVACNNLGVALGQAGDVAGAAEQFRAALRLDPDYVDARRNLSIVEGAAK